MTIVLIVFKSLRQHALSTIVTALSIALAGGLLMSVWSVKDQSQDTFTGVNAGFDAVGQRLWAIEAELVNAVPATLPGLLAKVRYARTQGEHVGHGLLTVENDEAARAVRV